MTTPTPYVSIIMLTYNRANYIKEAIQSALSQTYTNFELIIIDDGSTDNTSEIVKNYSDNRIRYIKDSTNKGLYARRRESLSHTAGDYVAILDSDDIWSSPTKLQKQVAFMEENKSCAVVGGFITLINETGAEVGKNAYYTTDSAIRSHMLLRNQFANSSVLMRKSILEKTTGYQNYAPCEDFELFLQLGRFGTFANIPEYLLHYRIHSGGESARKRKVIPIIREIIKIHHGNYPNYYRAVIKFWLYNILSKLNVV